MPYDNKQIAKRLQDTAQGEYYDGNSLLVAKDIPGITEYEKSILEAWLTGTFNRDPFEYRMRLQDIAIKIRFMD